MKVLILTSVLLSASSMLPQHLAAYASTTPEEQGDQLSEELGDDELKLLLQTANLNRVQRKPAVLGPAIVATSDNAPPFGTNEESPDDSIPDHPGEPQ